MSNLAGFGFDILARAPDSAARLGRLITPHGAIETPAFLFCATKGAIKAATMDQMREAGADIILANTYHLMIQPGAERVRALGGLHRMMGWSGPMLTDSGGFQIFSMGHGGVADEIKGRNRASRPASLLRVTEEGAVFRSYLDGRKLTLTPEQSIQIQCALGADLIVQLDECTPFHSGKDYIARSTAMSMRWGDRCLAELARQPENRQALYGVVQGGTDPSIRRESAEYTADRPFFGTAIGGTLGGSKPEMYEVVANTMPHTHPDRPVHLLGIGGFGDIFEAVAAGVDTLDCVHPTRVARHGWALKKGAPNERINLRNARFADDTGPIDETCPCRVCQIHSTGYLHHLVRAGEITGMTLLTIHNVATMSRLMRDVRGAIAEDRLDAVKGEWLAS